MLKKNNAHFEELRKIGYDYEERKEALEARKQEIVDTYGWDSEEMKAWYKEKAELTFPLSGGACKAYRAYNYSLQKGNEEFEMEDFLWDREVEDFVSTLKAAGIETFIYTNQSTAVMENLHGFEEAGCRMDGLAKITRMERRYGENREEQILGIHFTVC